MMLAQIEGLSILLSKAENCRRTYGTVALASGARRITANPEVGISLGGGLRKVRILCEDGGKSRGFRTIYIFGSCRTPIFLITVFARNEKEN